MFTDVLCSYSYFFWTVCCTWHRAPAQSLPRPNRLRSCAAGAGAPPDASAPPTEAAIAMQRPSHVADQSTAHGSVTHIARSLLHDFNFHQIAELESVSNGEGTAHRAEYIRAAMAFCPMEVAARRFGKAVQLRRGSLCGYKSLADDSFNLGHQAYYHRFEGAVLFIDISGFTELCLAAL